MHKSFAVTMKDEQTDLAKVKNHPAELFGLNDDCWQMIFEHLSSIDLVNVVEAYGNLISAAESVFSRRHRNKVYVLSSFCTSDEKNNADSLMRHFGKYMTNMQIDCQSEQDAVELSIGYGKMNVKTSPFSDWFEPKSLEMSFAQLKHLKIHDENDTVSKSTVVEILRLNPRLAKLQLKKMTTTWT